MKKTLYWADITLKNFLELWNQYGIEGIPICYDTKYSDDKIWKSNVLFWREIFYWQISGLLPYTFETLNITPNAKFKLAKFLQNEVTCSILENVIKNKKHAEQKKNPFLSKGRKVKSKGKRKAKNKCFEKIKTKKIKEPISEKNFKDDSFEDLKDEHHET